MNETRKLLDYWLPPEGAGHPIACVATSFTFDPDFFEQQCLGRFLGLNANRDEGDPLSFIVEQEERLAEARASVLVDRSYNPEGRSLRWDLIPLGVRGGLLHAKVAILIWQNLIRFLVTSANLTTAGYRHQVEAAVALDAHAGSRIERKVFTDLIAALGELFEKTPGDFERPGPKQRAFEALETTQDRIDSLDLPQRTRSGLWMKVITAQPGRPALPPLRQFIGRAPARRATVMSPFFETDESSNRAATALFAEMAQRGDRRADFVVPVSSVDVHTVVAAPRSILRAVPRGAQVKFRPFLEPPPSGDDQHKTKDERRLHAKAIALENDRWFAVMIGSSNFTSSGLGLNPHAGHLEINMAFCAAIGSREQRDLRQLISMGNPVDTEEVSWDPDPDPEEPATPPLPLGFVQCLLEPRPDNSSTLIMTLEPSELPDVWWIEEAAGKRMLDSDSWRSEGALHEKEMEWTEEQLPFFLQVKWEENSASWSATWPVNVTEPGKLPPPQELRSLPSEALLRALASTRPLMDVLPSIVQRLKGQEGLQGHDELDPLKRHSTAGLLLQRTRSLSRALFGLRQRLERPAANLDALEWRLNGPFGPKAIAQAMLKETDDTGIQGERSFFLAEIVLTLSRVDWESTARFVRIDDVLAVARKTLADLKELHDAEMVDARLIAYVDGAFEAATL